MQAVIVAGGRGERLRPLTDNIPKPMVEIDGKPILEHQIELLKKHGIREIIICGHYLFYKIKEYFGDGSKWEVSIKYLEEKKPLGSGGAIKNAGTYINHTFLDLNGDAMIKLNLTSLINFHKNHDGIATLVLHKSDHPYDSDLVEIDKNNRIIRFLGRMKKGQKFRNLTKAGLHVFEPKVLEYMPKGKFTREDILPILLKREAVYGYITNEFIKDIGTPDRYEKVKERFERGEK